MSAKIAAGKAPKSSLKRAAAGKSSPGKGPKYVYLFGKKTDGGGSQKPLLGGKGANLAEMSRIGLPVPPGFTLTTEVCTYYYSNRHSYPPALEAQVAAGIASIESQFGSKFGDLENPLLVSVRSGARDSMPGMMDTILNLGLNDQTVAALARKTANERFAWDCYRRFVQMYGDVVMGVQKRQGEEHDPFESLIETLKRERHNDHKLDDTKLSADDLKELVNRFRGLIKERTGKSFPVNPWEQLKGAITAVFGSWMNDRAIVYRRKYNIPQEWGTAVNVQAMVYGNTGVRSGSGVAFTRNPATGEKIFYGEFLMNAQGEDVVSGVRTPQPVLALRDVMPSAYQTLERIRQALEKHFRDVQDFEFTIQDSVVYMLQTRNAKRTGIAAVRIASEMVKERLIDWRTAMLQVPADQLGQVLAPIFEKDDLSKANEEGEHIAGGLPAGPGAASGRIYFNADRAVEAAKKGEKSLLVRIETSPEDLRGMIAAEGILTARGGVSSHAALVARQMGKVCVCGASALHIDYQNRILTVEKTTFENKSIGGRQFKEGDYLSIDGTSGYVYGREVKSAPAEVIKAMVDDDAEAKAGRTYRNFAQLMKWCAKATRLAVRTNADTPEQARIAVIFGATGIGLTRTEHMFFEGDRIDAMREMILADTKDAREAALAKLLPYQREDFHGIFKALKGHPATIRFLDPPLHEFLPKSPDQQKDLARKMEIPVEKIVQRVNELHEENPMLGFRGCRLGIKYPEITAMQARAVFEAAALAKKEGLRANPEIMIPLVGFKAELDLQVAVVHDTAAAVQAEKKVKLNYTVGTMIEVPRGALTADEIALTAEFFSFGTNDLTQTVLGMSRDDSGSFLGAYQEADIMPRNPFATIDQAGVGQLMKIAIEKGRSTRPEIKLGICGEHGGDPDSVKFCHRIGLDYVSCSPLRVPVARLAAAQAALADRNPPPKNRSR